ncbi:MAG: HD domain-containing protein [Lentisphaerae bacterium]|nr:HD domain-containing protein [Lentisphaerota bacterium]
MDPIDIIKYFYPQDTMLRKLLIWHSEQVRDKALQIAKYNKKLNLDTEILVNGAMLHDIGIGKCRAKDIFCLGTEPYIKHGILGAKMLREYGRENGLDLEVYARICERHTGSGLTAAEIKESGLPLPEEDFLPETPEEKVICLADKFYSKSGNGKEKKLKTVVRSMEKFGDGPVHRFLALCREFHMQKIPPVTTAFMEALAFIVLDILIAFFTICLCPYWKSLFLVKIVFILVFFLRTYYFYRKRLLLRQDVWLYQIFYFILVAITSLIH